MFFYLLINMRIASIHILQNLNIHIQCISPKIQYLISRVYIFIIFKFEPKRQS